MKFIKLLKGEETYNDFIQSNYAGFPSMVMYHNTHKNYKTTKNVISARNVNDVVLEEVLPEVPDVPPVITTPFTNGPVTLIAQCLESVYPDTRTVGMEVYEYFVNKLNYEDGEYYLTESEILICNYDSAPSPTKIIEAQQQIYKVVCSWITTPYRQYYDVCLWGNTNMVLIEPVPKDIGFVLDETGMLIYGS